MGQSIALSPEALIKMLAVPDWRVDFARVGHALSNACRTLNSTTIEDGKLRFRFGDGKYDVSFPIEVIEQYTPWSVRIKNTYPLVQMRKKIEGGGFHQVDTLMRSIWLSNRRIESEHAKTCCEQLRQEQRLEPLQVISARVESCGGKESVIDIPEWGFADVHFLNGEVNQVTMRGKKLKRGMVVHVSSRYTGDGVGVIVGFGFQKALLPILISMGGSDGELISAVHPNEISFFPTQAEAGRAPVLRV